MVSEQGQLLVSKFVLVVYILSGANLGFLRGGANHSSGSLRKGVWGAQPPRSYRIFCFMKYRNAKI